jgi:DNA-binding LytR/AlgR family response regulator
MVIDCAVVEDESITRAMIEGMAKRTGFLSIANSFEDPIEAVHWLNQNQVELIFLDIEMPGFNGLQVIKSLVYKPYVIIISSNTSYAFDAIQLSVVDYLKKPVDEYSRFLQSVSKVVALKKKNAPVEDTPDLFIKEESLLVRIGMNEINWVEAFGDYVKIHTEKKVHISYGALKKIEEKLPKGKFIKVHRSFIINIQKITNIDNNNLVIGGRTIPISDNYKKQLLESIRIFS